MSLPPAGDQAQRETWLFAGVDLGWLLTLCCAAWLSVVMGLAFWTLVPMVAGWHPRVVLTGSMTPNIDPGDVVLVAPVKDPAALPVGSVALVRDPERDGGSYVHRVVLNAGDGTFVTRGDANRSDDFPAVTPDRVMGRALLVVPRVGLPMVWIRHHRYVPPAVVLVATWLSMYAVIPRRPRAQHHPHAQLEAERASPLAR
jgi:signal peptidase